MTKYQTDRPSRRPLEQVHCHRGDLDRDRLISLCSERSQRSMRVRLVLPRDAVLGTECGLGDRTALAPALVRTRRDAAQHDALDTRCVGGAKNGSGVVQAANVIEDADHALIVSGHRLSTPDAQLPTSNHSQLPMPNSQERSIGSWELGVVGNWELVVGNSVSAF